MRRQFSEAVKLKAVFEIETCELSRKGAARRYGCDPASVRGWLRKYGNGKWRDCLAGVSMSEESAKIKKLEEELKRSQTRNRVYEEIFKLAKEEMGIDLKKNFDTELLRRQGEQLPKSVKPVK